MALIAGKSAIRFVVVLTVWLIGNGVNCRPGNNKPSTTDPSSIIMDISDDIRSFGPNYEDMLDDLQQEEANRIYLARMVPADGILYKIEAYFMTSDPIYIQIWRRKNSKHQLKFSKKIINDGPNEAIVTKYMDIGANECVSVRQGDLLGIYSRNNPTTIPKFSESDPILVEPYTLSGSNNFQVGLERIFSDTANYQFAVTGFIYTGPAGQGSGSQNLVSCPQNLTPGSDTSSEPKPTLTRPTPASTSTSTTTSTTTTTSTITTSTPKPTTTSRTTSTPTVVTEEQGTTAQAAGTGSQSQQSMFIGVGVVGGVVVIVLVTTIILLIRRQKLKSSSSSSTKSLDTSNQSYTTQLPQSSVKPSTKNVCYGMPCDFIAATSNGAAPTYESMSNDTREPEVDNTYHPIVPPRPRTEYITPKESPKTQASGYVTIIGPTQPTVLRSKSECPEYEDFDLPGKKGPYLEMVMEDDVGANPGSSAIGENVTRPKMTIRS